MSICLKTCNLPRVAFYTGCDLIFYNIYEWEPCIHPGEQASYPPFSRALMDMCSCLWRALSNQEQLHTMEERPAVDVGQQLALPPEIAAPATLRPDLMLRPCFSKRRFTSFSSQSALGGFCVPGKGEKHLAGCLRTRMGVSHQTVERLVDGGLGGGWQRGWLQNQLNKKYIGII